MKKLLILAVLLAANCRAVPPQERDSVKLFSTPLQRPSPINPDIKSDPKPPEKITMITDPKEIAKHKREIKEKTAHPEPTTYLLPTISPTHDQSSESSEVASHEHVAREPHHRQKRNQKSALAVEKSSTQKPFVKPVSIADKSETKPKPTSSNRRNKPKSTTAAPLQKKVASAPEITKQRQRRDVSAHSEASVIPAPAVQRGENKQVAHTHHQNEYAATQSLIATSATAETTPLAYQPTTLNQPTSKVALAASSASSQHAASAYAKRDIPVPLVPKYHHPEESINPIEGKVENVEAKHETNENIPITNVHHALNNAAVAASMVATLHPKRDIPVPLVPKYQHPEESPKTDEQAKNEYQQRIEHQEEPRPHATSTAETKKSENEARKDVTVDILHATHETAQSHPHLQQSHLPIQHEFYPQKPHTLHAPLEELPHSAASTTSTTAHPIVRPHPVSVSELFARPKASHETEAEASV